MSDNDFGGFAPPAFDAANALVGLKRSLRELGLAERGNGFEQRGRRLVEVSAEDQALQVKLAKRPMLTPEWDRLTLKSGADVRKCLDELKKRLARWEREE